MSIIYQAVEVAFQVYYFLILGRIILSFVKHNPYSPAIRFIYELTEPYLALFRRFIPTVGMFDFSPIVALFALHFIKVLVFTVLGVLF